MHFPGRNILLVLFSLLILVSCEYKPKGDYYRDLSITPPTGVTITIPGSNDTLVSTYGHSYMVSVGCANHSVLFYRVYINDVQKDFQKVKSNDFFIEPSAYTGSGHIYRMTIEVGINTGSGSIGDNLGTEGYLFRREFILLAAVRNTDN